MTLDYLDFELEIGQPTGQSYPITVLNSPAGNARSVIQWSLGELALENRLKDVQIALLGSGGVRRTLLTPAEQAVQRFGAELFDLLFNGEIRNRYDVSQLEAHHQGKGLRVKLRIQPPALAVLPWEFLHDPRRGEYICLSQQTPLVRYLELPQTHPSADRDTAAAHSGHDRQSDRSVGAGCGGGTAAPGTGAAPFAG